MIPLTRPLCATAALAAISSASAGDTYVAPPAPAPVPVAAEGASDVSGWLSLDYNSHFVSYGADVWGAGNSVSDALFNPSFGLDFDLGGAVLSVGSWWDVNDLAESPIGGNIQEIDVWAGISTDFGPVNVSLTYQAWFYAEDTEHIIDLGLSFDAPLAPSITIHGRPDAGASGGDTGVVAVLGFDVFAVGDGVSAGPVEFSAPISVAAATDGYHGGGSGFAYASAGLNFSVPVASGSLGDWDIHGGVTYFYTNDNVIPNNPDESFLTLSAGIGLSF